MLCAPRSMPHAAMLHATRSYTLHALHADMPACACCTCFPHLACLTLAASLKYNGLDDDAKRLLQAANSERSSPAVLEL